MFKALFKLIFNLLGTIVQTICIIPNTIILKTMPDLTDKIVKVTATLEHLFDGLGWALGLIPTPVTEVLLFIVTIEIAKHTIYVSTHTLLKIWNLVQKIKFW